MKTIVISNRKGGSAKTTTAVNLATELAKNHSVLLIDFDTQGHASIGVGSAPVEEGGAHSVFLGHTLSENFIPTVLNNLTLAPAHAFFDVYEHSNLRGVLKNRFQKERISDFFEYCIIDTAPTFDAVLKNSLEVADVVVIPFVPHHLGVIAVGQMVRAVYQISTQMNAEIKHVGMLPVMYNPHIEEHRTSIAKVQSSFGKAKLFTPIGTDIKLSQQFESGKPIVLMEKRTKGMQDYKNFCAELLLRIE